MLEIIALIALVGKIGDMARRRGRSPALLGLLLIVCWFGGEVAGAVLGYKLSAGRPNMLLIYGLALAGAGVGVGIAFLVARSLSPVDGVWRELPELSMRRSRLWGAVIGGVAGGVIGAIFVVVMYRGQQEPPVVASFFAVGFLGALLGLISGVPKL